MNRTLVIGFTALVLTSTLAIVAWHSSLALVFNLPGLLLVFGGTLLATMLSQSRQAVVALLRSLPHKLAESSEDRSTAIDTMLILAGHYWRAEIRAADTVVNALPASFLKIGVGLVIDRHSKDHLMRILQWHIGKQRREFESEVLMLNTMGACAPAFGMLGTLFGLIRMLYGLGDSGLSELGASMGFAMMSTVYGLMAATLIFKPLVVKLERRAQRMMVWRYAQYEAILMIHEHAHPQLIKEYLDAFLDHHDIEALEHPDVALLHTLKA